jgi:hypothetical protein
MTAITLHYQWTSIINLLYKLPTGRCCQALALCTAMSLYSAPPITYLTHCQTVASPYTHSKPLQIKAGFSTSKTKKCDYCSF